MPFHIAFGMTKEQADGYRPSEAELTAWSIIMSEYEGNRFDWDIMKFIEPRR